MKSTPVTSSTLVTERAGTRNERAFFGRKLTSRSAVRTPHVAIGHCCGSATKSKFVIFSTMFTTRVGTAKA